MLDPDTGERHHDILDVLEQAATTREMVRLSDDQIEERERIDSDIIWWQAHAVNSTRFARMALMVVDWERLGQHARNHMPAERALVIEQQVMAISKAYRRSIDAKSSESKRDQNNAQATFLDRVARRRTEHVYTAGDAGGRGLRDAVFGRRQDADLERSM